MTHFIFDCDDVLLNWQSAFAEWHSVRYFRSPLRAEGPQTWCLGEWLGCDPAEARQRVAQFNASQYFGRLHPMPNAVELVYRLRFLGHTMSVVTSCGDSAAMRRARMQNLDAVFGAEAFQAVSILGLGASKFEYLSFASRSRNPAKLVFVEDNFEHARSGIVNGITSYCLRRSHNRQEEANNPDSAVIWIDDLRSLFDRYAPQVRAIS